VNKQRNGCQFIAVHGAVTTREVLFFRASADSDGGQVADEGDSTVPTYSVAELETLAGKPFDTIVMDIEGAEVAFVNEHESLLPGIRTLIIEFHPGFVGEGQVDEVRRRLGCAGLHPTDRMLHVEAFVR
jgi:hypothetical protein